jgi:hypothetical protein
VQAEAHVFKVHGASAVSFKSAAFCAQRDLPRYELLVQLMLNKAPPPQLVMPLIIHRRLGGVIM